MPLALKTRRHLILAGLAIAAAGGAAFFALIPYGGPPDHLQHPIHMLAFALVSVLFAAAMPRRPWLGLLIAILLGAGIEGAQMFVPGRSAGLGDLAANLAGVLLGGAVYVLIAWHLRETAQYSRHR